MLKRILLFAARAFVLARFAVVLASCASRPTMQPSEVIRVADTAARRNGFDLRHFQRDPPRYNFVVRDDEWFVSYEGKPDKNGMVSAGDHFAVNVHDKTRTVRIDYGR